MQNPEDYKPVLDWYNEIARIYVGTEDPSRVSYHAMRFESIVSLIEQTKLPKKSKVFDFGCGSGEMFDLLRPHEFVFDACDIASKMLDLARGKLPPNGHLYEGGLEVLEQSEGDYSLILALDVLPFLTDEDEERFYAASHRKLVSGGFLLTTQANLLFDIVTFNRYTVDFFQEHLLPSLPIDSTESAKLLEDFKSLLTFPDEPSRPFTLWKGGAENVSVREAMRRRMSDPFEYPEILRRHGFSVVDDRSINVFPMPPRIIERNQKLILAQHAARKHMKSKTLSKIFSSTFQVLSQRD